MGLHCDLGEIAADSLTHSPTTVDSRDASASKNTSFIGKMNNRSKAALLLMRPTFNVDKKIKNTK